MAFSPLEQKPIDFLHQFQRQDGRTCGIHRRHPQEGHAFLGVDRWWANGTTKPVRIERVLRQKSAQLRRNLGRCFLERSDGSYDRELKCPVITSKARFSECRKTLLSASCSVLRGSPVSSSARTGAFCLVYLRLRSICQVIIGDIIRLLKRIAGVTGCNRRRFSRNFVGLRWYQPNSHLAVQWLRAQ